MKKNSQIRKNDRYIMKRFEDYRINDMFEYLRFVSNKDVQQYAMLVGDVNPIHLNEDYARTTCYKDRIVHGPFVCGIIGKVLGVDFPGPGTILLSQELKFMKPVYVDSEIRIVLHIVEIILDKRRLMIDVNVYNENNELVIVGKTKVWYPC